MDPGRWNKAGKGDRISMVLAAANIVPFLALIHTQTWSLSSSFHPLHKDDFGGHCYQLQWWPGHAEECFDFCNCHKACCGAGRRILVAWKAVVF